MPISSSTLFHFTDSPDNLIGILTEEFYPRFCLEDQSVIQYLSDGELSEIAIPMVCFCDLPLSMISEHLEFYGKYGIGLTKNWGLKQGINPLLYFSPDSTLNYYLSQLCAHGFTSNAGQSPDIFLPLSEFISFIKPLEGLMYKNGEFVEKYFYNEREWRFVPRLVSDGETVTNFDYRLTKEEFIDEIKRAHANKDLESRTRLGFTPNDIKYIIVSRESEINSTINAIRAIKSKYDPATIDLLTSRIISSEQIASDF